MSFETKEEENKKDYSIVYILLFASCVSIFTILVAYYFSNKKHQKSISLSNLITIDYQVESAVIMQLQKLKNNTDNKPKNLEREIMPGIFMKISCEQDQTKDNYLFDSTISGIYVNKRIQIKGCKNTPDKLTFLESKN